MVKRVSYDEAVRLAKSIESEREGAYTYEDLPKVDLTSFCSVALNSSHPSKRTVDDKTIYACNLKSYSVNQIPGDLTTEITEIDEGDRSIVVIQDKTIVTSPELSKADLVTPKTIIFEAAPGGVYDPELDAVCWTSLRNPDYKLCIDNNARIFVFNAVNVELPQEITSIEDFDLLTKELGIRKFPGEKINTIFDILKKDRAAVESKIGYEAVAGAYLSGIGEAVSPSTRLKKYSESKWKRLKIQKIGPTELPMMKYLGKAEKIREHRVPPTPKEKRLFAEQYQPEGYVEIEKEGKVMKKPSLEGETVEKYTEPVTFESIPKEESFPLFTEEEIKKMKEEGKPVLSKEFVESYVIPIHTKPESEEHISPIVTSEEYMPEELTEEEKKKIEEYRKRAESVEEVPIWNAPERLIGATGNIERIQKKKKEEEKEREE